jgi:hypothetical protein
MAASGRRLSKLVNAVCIEDWCLRIGVRGGAFLRSGTASDLRLLRYRKGRRGVETSATAVDFGFGSEKFFAFGHGCLYGWHKHFSSSYAL